MPNYKEEKYIYHFTPLQNIPGILSSGLMPRNALEENGFIDVADPNIIDARAQHGLDKYVPFHWVYGSAYDYNVYSADVNCDMDFVYILVDRTVAENENWKIIPTHPLAGGQTPKILGYTDGFNQIDWSCMRPHYNTYSFKFNDKYHKTTMAECLAPSTVPTSKISKILVSNDEVVDEICDFIEDFMKNNTFIDGLSTESTMGDVFYDISTCDGVGVVNDKMNFNIEIRPDIFSYFG